MKNISKIKNRKNLIFCKSENENIFWNLKNLELENFHGIFLKVAHDDQVSIYRISRETQDGDAI